MSFWCLQFPPKNERKQVDLRFHSSKVEFVRSFFGGNICLKKSFRLFLTFREYNKAWDMRLLRVQTSQIRNFELVPQNLRYVGFYVDFCWFFLNFWDTWIFHIFFTDVELPQELHKLDQFVTKLENQVKMLKKKPTSFVWKLSK